MNNKERKKAMAMTKEAFIIEYGPGVFEKLMRKGLIKWDKK